MRKYMIYLAVTGMIMSLCACGKTPRKAVTEEETTKTYEQEMERESESEPETDAFLQSTVLPKERTTHHESDAEKDRFLAFLNNEIPIMEYPLGAPQTALYCGDIMDGDPGEKRNEAVYAIMDVNGSGENEYIFYGRDGAVCMSYDEENERFVCQMFWDTKDTFFLGDGQVMFYHAGETNVYTYAVYDERWKVKESRRFAITLTEDPLIEIDGDRVTEDTWKEEFDWIMDRYHTRPQMMTLEDLCN